MDYTEVKRCLGILAERPAWPFGKENIDKKLECLEQLKNTSLLYVNPLVGFLTHDHALIRQKAAETLLQLAANQPNMKARAEAVKFFSISPADLDLYRQYFDDDLYLQLLGLASFNGSGYTRQKAVLELSKLNDARGLKFILFRLADWVKPVRQAALDALNNLMQPANVKVFLEELPTIEWLLSVGRVNLKDVYERVMVFLVDRDVTLEGLTDKARLYYSRQLLKRKSLSKEDLFQLARDNNFLVQLEVLKNVKDPGEELIGILLHARSAKVRATAMYSTNDQNKIIELLADGSASVRELSCYLLKEKGIDFSSIYRENISKGQSLEGSIMGLAETGAEEDVSLFENYLHSSNNNLVVASLAAINKFDDVKAAWYAINFLTHASARVRRKAVEVLAKNTDAQAFEKLGAIYASGNAGVRVAVLKLYHALGGWRVLSALLLATADEDARVQNLAWTYLENWKVKAANNFTTPPPHAIENANEILRTIKTADPSRQKLLAVLAYIIS